MDSANLHRFDNLAK